MAFVVEDVSAEYQRLSEAGVDFVSSPNRIDEGVNAGGWTVYFIDPDGITLELVQPPDHASL
jgi:predicted enzyme related to lactoylglutathione lyase